MPPCSWHPARPSVGGRPAVKEVSDGKRVKRGAAWRWRRAAAGRAAAPAAREREGTVAKPANPLARAQRSASFWKQVGPVLVNLVRLGVWEDLAKAINVKGPGETVWEHAHEWGSREVADATFRLRGFYVKSGQIIGSRPDLFPEQYCQRLRALQDGMDPMPFETVRRVVESSLSGRQGQAVTLDDVFREFDETPIGSASIAQVHRAVVRGRWLSSGRDVEVAVKVQRPDVEDVMKGDVDNVLLVSRALKDRLPVDYSKVFSEIAEAMDNEFDFRREAGNMLRVRAALTAAYGAERPGGNAVVRFIRRLGGEGDGWPVDVPEPYLHLCSREVLVMSFVRGRSLSALAADAERGNAAAVGTLGQRIVGLTIARALARAYAAMLFTPRKENLGTSGASGVADVDGALFHGDPHPGNILVTESLPMRVALVDWGQCKVLPRQDVERVERLVQLLVRRGSGQPASQDALDTEIKDIVQSIGVKFFEDAPMQSASALATWLFDASAKQLPSGDKFEFETGELSKNSPIAQVQNFPQSLVFLGRASVLIRGLCAKMNVTKWSLAEEWTEFLIRRDNRDSSLLARFAKAVLNIVRRWCAAWWHFRRTVLRVRW